MRDDSHSDIKSRCTAHSDGSAVAVVVCSIDAMGVRPAPPRSLRDTDIDRVRPSPRERVSATPVLR